MIVKLLGLLDLVVAIILAASNSLPNIIVKQAGFYLTLKGLFFSLTGDFASIIDFFVGIYIIISSFGVQNTIVSLIVFLYLLQKAIFSLFS